MKQIAIDKLKKLTRKNHIFFMSKCRKAAELLMIYSKNKGFKDLILQEEGGWHTYEKSAKKLNLGVLKAKMERGVIVEKDFPKKENSIILINTNPGYAYIEPFNLYDELKDKNNIIINDIVGSIGNSNSLKGDFLIGSFGKDKPLSISSGGAFIAFNDPKMLQELQDLKKEYFKDDEVNINFEELSYAIDKVKIKKNKWIVYSNKLKKDLKDKGFTILNNNDSINIFVRLDLERENLIKYCQDNNLQYQICPLYIRSMDDALSIEIKKLNLEE
jgi:DNA-binding transcriptional ArsR family regulator